MSLSLLLSYLFFLSCGKGSVPGTENVVPSNLSVTAVVSADNSGTVNFTATGTNVAKYEYDFGNGVFQTVTNGAVSYRYPASGNYTVNVIGKSSTGQSISKSINVAVTVAMGLVWSDEFNTDGAPDPAKWGYDLGTGGSGWGNNELQYYTNRPENVIVSGGTLKINAKREAFMGSAFTSSRLLTKNKFVVKYGKIEVRAKLPTGVGTWPAIWMLGANIDAVSWPACGEIDIMEHKGSDENRIYSTLHHPGHSGGNGDGNTTIVQNVASAFHVYTCEWTPTQLKFSVDGGAPHFVFNNNPNVPFNHNYFILLNFAMGGTFGGPVAASFNASTMEVDYVRVYN